ncbi:MAG: hypothetical protein RJA07_2635 [Bacteroidota bacterium]|jgi:hypothetical protein
MQAFNGLAQNQLPMGIRGALVVETEKPYCYKLQGKNLQAGSWKLFPLNSGEMIAIDSLQSVTVKWKNYCSKAKLEWSPIENSSIILATDITIKACTETEKNCLFDKPLQAGMIDAHSILQNGIWAKYQCDTSNAMTVELRLDDKYTTKLSVLQTDNIKWFFENKAIGKGEKIVAHLPSGNQKIAVKICDSIPTIEFDLIIPTNTFLQIKGIPEQPICAGNSINMEAVSTDSRALLFTKWMLNEDWYWFEHVSTKIKNPKSGNISTVNVASIDEYGCINEIAKEFVVSNGFGLSVNTMFSKALPDSIALLQPDTVGFIQSSIFGGTAPFRYEWKEREKLNGKTFSTSPSLKTTNTKVEYFQLRVTDKYGCQAISSATLNPIIFRERYKAWKRNNNKNALK